MSRVQTAFCISHDIPTRVENLCEAELGCWANKAGAQFLSTVLGSSVSGCFLPDRQAPIDFLRGLGGRVFDVEGNDYIDLICGVGPVVLGHANPHFNDLVFSELSKGLLFPSTTSVHERVADELCGSLGCDATAIYFKTGSESVSAAIRCGSILTGATGVVRCGYIGWHDVQIGGTPAWHEPIDSQLRAGRRFLEGMRGIVGAEHVLDWTSLQPGDLAEAIDDSEHPFGALVLDMYQLHYGDLASVRAGLEVARARAIPVILDETKTAGRAAATALAHDLDLYWDGLVLGKALGNGAPVSVLLVREGLADAAATTRIGGTFAKDLIGPVCIEATREIMSSSDGYERLKRAGTAIHGAVADVLANLDICEVVACDRPFGGSFLELRVLDRSPASVEARQTLRADLASAGVLLLEGHPSFICLAHEEVGLDELSTRFELGMRTWRKRVGCKGRWPSGGRMNS
jgi:glutamate-1-semialdehyde 2,1-aminomutase